MEFLQIRALHAADFVFDGAGFLRGIAEEKPGNPCSKEKDGDERLGQSHNLLAGAIFHGFALFESFDFPELSRLQSSTTSGSASLMSLRILPRVSPRQSPSSAILFEMSFDADWPWLAPDFFMFSS
jgi:hypothetical protein